jgi:hypothetical protein
VDTTTATNCGDCGDACGMGETCRMDSGLGRYACCCGTSCSVGEECRGGQNCCGMPAGCSGSC